MAITTVSIDPETYRRLRHLAVEEDTNVRVLVRRAVAEYLERHSERRKRK
jgi:predicted transcriptional regulator